MTPTELVQHEIARFLSSAEPEVLCIRGEWGVGKTFTWQSELRKAAASEQVELSSYAYVSLFGLSSLDALKIALFSNTEPLREVQGKDIQAAAEKHGWWIWRKAKQAAPIATAAWLGEGAAAFNPLFFSRIHDQLICIDDLERRSSGLEVKDVLGVVSFLKEQRRCKIVLLLNDKELGEEGAAQFREYLEKVIDGDLLFAPEPEDSVRIAFPDPDEIGGLLGEHCKTLRISNIRVIKRIERLVRNVQPMLNMHDARVFRQAAHTLTLLGWVKYQPNVAPTLDFVKGRGGFSGPREGDVHSERDAAWSALLDEYQFWSVDEFDLELSKALEKGYFNPDLVANRAAELTAKFKLEDENGSFEQAWRIYHDSFANNRDEVLDTIYNSFKNTVRSISPLNVDGTVRLFRDLGRHSEADELIDFYINNRDEGRAFWDLDEYAFSGEVRDERVRRAFSAKLASFDIKVDPEEILKNIAHTKTWSPREISLLAATAPEELRRIFKGQTGPELTRLVSAALQFDRIVNATPEMREVSKRAKEALVLIGRETDINARRVAKYGVVIPPDDVQRE